MWLSSDSTSASSNTFTLKDKITPRCLSFALIALASIMSLRVTGPISALEIGICLRLSISVNASNEPIVSHFKIRPVVSVSINTDFISDSNNVLNSSVSAESDVA